MATLCSSPSRPLYATTSPLIGTRDLAPCSTYPISAFPALLTTALNRLRDAGVGGPFAIALGEECYVGLTEATVGGYPVLEHLRRLIDGPLVWAPGVDGAVVLSTRGEDFELTVGEDFSIGYLDHDAERVRLYIEESFTFWLISPQAAVPLAYPAAAEN